MPKRKWSVGGKTSNYRTVTGYTRKKGLTASARTTALIKKVVQKQLELKIVDTQWNDLGISTNYASNTQFHSPNLIQAGVGNFNRNGNKIMPQSLRVRGIFEGVTIPDLTGAVGIVDKIIRMVVVWDKYPTGVFPNWNTIFEMQQSDGTDAQIQFANKNPEAADRFIVLRDKVVKLTMINPFVIDTSGFGVSTSYGCLEYFDEFINLKGKVTEYNGTANPATIAELAKGACYITWRGVTTNAFNFSNATVNARFTYLDG